MALAVLSLSPAVIPSPSTQLPARFTFGQGFGQAAHFTEALELFSRLHKEGHELNPLVFTTVLKLFVTMDRPELASDIFACIDKLGHESNAFVGTALLDSFSMSGLVDLARDVFDGILLKFPHT